MTSATEQKAREEEKKGVLAAVDDHAGPRSLFVLAVVSEKILQDVKNQCISQTNVEVTTQAKLQESIIQLQYQTLARRLAIIVSKRHGSIDVQVPGTFTSLEIIAAANANIHLSPLSTYCNIPFSQWNKRSCYEEHILTLRPRVYIEVPDYEFPAEEIAPPFDYNDDDQAELVATSMKDQIESTPTLQVAPRHSNALPWLMGAAGAGASIGTAAYLVTNFEFGIAGAYISCGPVTAAYGSVTGTMSLAAAGGLTLGAGVAAVAAVYFIPWNKLANWAAKAWDLFLIFLKSIWKCVTWVWDLFVRFVKLLIKAMRDFVTHLTNGMKWVGSMMYASTFG